MKCVVMSLTPSKVVVPSLFLLLLVAGAWARDPDNALVEIASGDLFKNIFKGITDYAKQLLADMHRQSAKAANGFAEQVQKAAHNFIKEAQEYGEQLASSLQGYLHGYLQQSVAHFLSTLKAFRANINTQLQHMQHDVQRDLLKQVEQQLNELKQAALGLRELVMALQLNITQITTSYEQATLQRWSVWTNEQLDAVAQNNNDSDIAVDQAEKIINEFVNRYRNLLHSCSKELEAELQAYDLRVRDTVERYQPVLDKLIKQVELCLQTDQNSTAKIAKECEQHPREQLELLKEAPNEFKSLHVQGRDLLNSRYDRRSCVIRTRADFNIELYDVERHVLNCLDCS